MHLIRSFICLLAFLFPVIVSGQPKENVLVGVARIKNGETCIYEIGFTITGSTIKGYSITTSQDGQELHAAINGSINRKKHTLSFIESNTLFNSPMLVKAPEGACLFDAHLSYWEQDGRYTIKGNFTGNDLDNKHCGDGTIEFNPPVRPEYLFDKPAVAKTPVKPQHSEKIATSVSSAEFQKIMSGEQAQLSWKSDTCFIEIWDAEEVDGDMVTISFNNQPVLENYILTSEKKQAELVLKGKVNTLTITAVNEGTAPPNTSQLVLSDRKTHSAFLVCLQKGKSADIILNRQQY